MSNKRMERQTAADPSIPLILAVDTSSPHASFAITQEDKVLAALSTEAFTPHSRTFFSNISTLLQLAGLEIADIGAFAAATGPGSFTGLRVGLAAVKALSHTLGKTPIGVNSIDVLALSAGIAGRVLVIIDAGRDEVYCGLREVSGDGMVSTLNPDRVGAPSLVLDGHLERMNDDPAIITGDGAFKRQDLLVDLANKKGAGLQTVNHFIRAVKSWQLKASHQEPAIALGQYAGRLLKKNIRPELHAYYIRPSDAEMKWSDSSVLNRGQG